MNLNKVSMSWYLETHHDTIPVQRGVRQVKVKCPWHEDRRASGVIYDDKQFKCFSGCHDGDRVDVLDIVQRSTGCSFKEAVEAVKDWPGEPVEGSDQTNRRTRDRARRGAFKFRILGV